MQTQYDEVVFYNLEDYDSNEREPVSPICIKIAT